MVLLKWKKKETHNFSLCVNTWLAGCSVSSSWQYFSMVPSTSSPGSYNFFSSLIRLISFTYDHTWYKNTQTHMFSCLLTLLTTHKPTRWTNASPWEEDVVAGVSIQQQVESPKLRFLATTSSAPYFFSCKINQTDEKTKITNGSILPQNLEKVKPLTSQ